MRILEINPEYSEADWIASESIRRLMYSRSRMMSFATLTMLIIAMQLYGYVNTLLVVLWFIVSIIITVFRYHVKKVFNQRIALLHVTKQKVYIHRYSLVWTLTAFVWGIAGWLCFNYLPVQNLYICASILNLVGFIGVINLTYHKQIVKYFVNTLMSSQILAVIYGISFKENFQSPSIHYFHLISLIIIWGMLTTIYVRFHSGYLRNLKLQYHNHQLIQNLSQQTEQLAHEKQVALNANDVIQRFYSSAAHDIRQPVYALKVYSDLAQEDPTLIPALLPKMSASCDAINALFESLFDFEQVNAGHVTMAHQNVDIGKLIEALEHHFKPMAERKNLALRTRVIPSNIFTDELLVKRILTCFLTNAIKYTQSGGILIAVRMKATCIDFEVWDTGIGIDAAHQKHIFEEFYKVGEFSSSDEGFGLGLSMVNKLSAYAENSKITMKSRLGKGSMFRFSLPIKVFTPPFYPSEFRYSKSMPLVIDHELA